MVTEVITGILGGKKAKKAAKKQKALQIKLMAETRRFYEKMAPLTEQATEEARLQTQLAREQFDIERAIVSEQRRQDRIETIREARVRRGQLLQSAASAGAGRGSSAVIGGLGALQSQFTSSLGVTNAFSNLQDKIAGRQKGMAESASRVQELQTQADKLQSAFNLTQSQISGQSNIVQANLAKSQANLQLFGGIGRAVEAGIAGFATGGASTSFTSPQFMSMVFGGGKTTNVVQ